MSSTIQVPRHPLAHLAHADRQVSVVRPHRPVRESGPLTAMLLRIWRAACRHAERPDRFVPYC